MSEDNRDEAVHLAGALQVKVDDIFARNDQLEAENDSLKVAFEAVSSENTALRGALDKRTRQRDAAAREADLLKAQLQKIYATAAETMRAMRPERVDKLPPADGAANLAFLKRPAAGG
jgi:FtsZ-binding cell division protein ZapB